MDRFSVVGLVVFSAASIALHTGEAATQTVNGVTWTYTVSNRCARVGSGSARIPAVPAATFGTIEIPSTLGKYPVTAVADYAFRNSRISGIVVGEGIETIGAHAFSGCSSLTGVVFRGDAPSLTGASTVFNGVGTNCTVYVKYGSTGWGVDIPGIWNGVTIAYSDALSRDIYLDPFEVLVPMTADPGEFFRFHYDLLAIDENWWWFGDGAAYNAVVLDADGRLLHKLKQDHVPSAGSFYYRVPEAPGTYYIGMLVDEDWLMMYWGVGYEDWGGDGCLGLLYGGVQLTVVDPSWSETASLHPVEISDFSCGDPGWGEPVRLSVSLGCSDPSQVNYVHFAAYDPASGDVYPVRALDGGGNGQIAATAGVLRVSWDAPRDLPIGFAGPLEVRAFASPRPLAHRWSFNGTYLDLVGTMDATPVGNVTMTNGTAVLAGGANGASHVLLGEEAFPGDVRTRTVELWATQREVREWSRIFDFGTDDSSYGYLTMTWTEASDPSTDCVYIPGYGNVLGRLSPYELGREYHISLTVGPASNGLWRVDCLKKDASTGRTLARYTHTDADPDYFVSSVIRKLYLGRSFFSYDDDAAAAYNEVRIWNAALTDDELTANALAGPDALAACATAGLTVAVSGTNRTVSVELLADAEEDAEPLASRVFAEGDCVYLRFRLGGDDPSPSPVDMYAFLVPSDPSVTNAVSCAAFERGVPISGGTTVSAAATAMDFTDGRSDTQMLPFRVELRKGASPESAKVDSCASSDLVVTVTNLPPVAARVLVDGLPSVPTNRATIGAASVFSVTVRDVPADLARADGFSFGLTSVSCTNRPPDRITADAVDGEAGSLTATWTYVPSAVEEGVRTVFADVSDGDGGFCRVPVTLLTAGGWCNVVFDLGGKGVRVGGGELRQTVPLPWGAVVPPAVSAVSGWVFQGWDRDCRGITNDTTVTALYRTSVPDLHVDAISVSTNTVDAGGKIAVSWTVGNTGNPPFTGKMSERILLVSAIDTNVVRELAVVSFDGTVARDGSVGRNALIDVPLKGWEGRWSLRVETAVDPSVREYSGNNDATAGETVEIRAVPLPDLSVSCAASGRALVPGTAMTFSVMTTNAGSAAAVGPWTDRICLESVGSGVAVKAGDLLRTNALLPAASTSGDYALTIPDMIQIAGAVRLKVLTDVFDDVAEADDENNAAFDPVILSLATNLYLSSASGSVGENHSSGVRFTVKRSGPVAEALTVAVSNTDTASVSTPATVTIPAGSVSTVFYAVPIDNAAVDGSRAAVVSVSAGACRPASGVLTVLDDEVPELTLFLDRTSVREGDGVITVTVTRELVSDAPLTVYLSGASTRRCSYPSSVVIPAGEASVTFGISVPDNDAAQIAQDFTLRASSSGYTSASVDYTVEDDDVPGVTLETYPEEISEGAGPQAAYAVLSRVDDKDIGSPITVHLSASETDRLVFPSSVTIPAYTRAVRFAFGAVDNGDDDGDREITVAGAVYIPSCGCSGQPSSGDVIEARIVVVDNDVPSLSLAAKPSTMREGVDEAGKLILGHNSVLSEDLTVSLSYDVEGEIEIPVSVTIPAGETAVEIPVKTVDDGETDGGKIVSVYADDASGLFASASTWLQVSDQNLPDPAVADVGTVSSVVAAETFDVSFTVTNTGFASVLRAIPYAVHLVRGAGANTVSSSTRVAGGTLAGVLEAGAGRSETVTLNAPEMPGDYRVAIILDPDGTVSELDAVNNTGWSSSVGVTAAYTATAGTDKKAYLPGETVTITGQATRADGSPAGNVQIEAYVTMNGMRRVLPAETAADGSYSAAFTTTGGAAGDYAVGACYPGTGSAAAQDSFSVIGMKRGSTENVIWDIAQGDLETRTVTIRNRSAVPLTGLTATFTDVPDECGFTYTLPGTIPANGSVTLSMTATAEGLTDQTDYRKFHAHLAVAEGLTLDIPLYFHSQAQKGFLRANPARIDTTMTVGRTRYVEVTVVNDGKGDSGRVSVSVPDVNWLKVVGGDSVDNLAAGESATVTLALSPSEADGLTLNAPLTGGRMTVDSERGSGCSVPLAFTPVSEATGSVTVDAVDNNTYALESAPHLSGATVRVINPYTGETVATGTTGSDGLWTATGIQEGRYRLVVTAPRHDTYADEVTIEPGRESAVTAFVRCTLVSATWEVVKSEIEDEYEIKLVLDYETQVPAPIVKTTMPDHFEEMKEGESVVFTMHVENCGVIAAEEVNFIPPEIEGHAFTFSDNDFRLAAGEARDVFVRFERLHSASTYSQRAAAGRLLASGARTGTMVGSWLMKQVVHYLCGGGKENYPVFNHFRYGKKTVVLEDENPDLPELDEEPDSETDGEDPVRKPLPADDPGDGSGRFVKPCPAVTGGSSKGCSISPCAESIVACILDLIGTAAEGNPLVGCIMGMLDCGQSVYETVNNPDRTALEVGSSVIDCGLGLSGCFGGSLIKSLVITGLGCVKNIALNCLIPKFMSTAQASRLLSASADTAFADAHPEFAMAVSIAEVELTALRNWYLEFFGDEEWVSCDSGELAGFLHAVKNVFTRGESVILKNELAPYLPSNVSDDLFDRFLSRWNAYLSGAVSSDDEPAGESEAFRPGVLVACTEEIKRCEAAVAEHGYVSILDFLREEGIGVLAEIAEAEESVCASVSLRFSQTLSMTREAFDGTLTMYNGNETTPITELRLDLSVLDEDGNECRDLFAVFSVETGEDAGGGSILDGGFSVPPTASRSATVRFVPERAAAVTESKVYWFGGTVTYVDPFTGEKASIHLVPVALTVSPSPYLKLDYFVQRDVFADDPFTPDVVEASMPAEMAVLVRNVGGGDADRVTIASARPETVQNEKGLSAAFDMKDYTLEASALNGATAHLGLNTVSLGTIEPNGSMVAQWWLTSSIEGHFVGMSASVSPVNSWNTPDTTLVDPDVGVHKLVRSVVADADALPDFLVCDGSDLYGTPNEIYTSRGDRLPVYAASVSAGDGLPPGEETELRAVLTPVRSGWNYAFVPVPGLFRYAITRVLRDDGTDLSLRNVWITDRTFRDGATPLLEERLHLVDDFSTASDRSYTVFLRAKPSDVPEVAAFEGVADGAVEPTSRDTVTVVFSKPIDPATFTVDDLTLMKQGVYPDDLSALAITAADDSGTRFVVGNLSALCGGYGRYELTVHCAGIADTVGQPGTAGKSVAWTYAAAAAPYVVSIEGVPAKRVRSLDAVTITLSAPVDPATVTASAFRLNGAALDGSVEIAPLDGSGTRFSVTGLSRSQLSDGEYALTVDAGVLNTAEGMAGAGDRTVSWTRDTVAPVLARLTRACGLGGTSFTVEFSEAVDPATLSPANIRLTRADAAASPRLLAAASAAGTDVPLPASVTIGDAGGGRYPITGLDGAFLEDGIYTLIFDAAGVADEAGNESSGTESVTWTVDTTAPVPAGDIAVSSGYGSVDTCVYTAVRDLTVSGTVPEAGLSVAVLARFADGGETLLAEPVPDDGLAFSADVVLPGDGNMTVVVRLTDAFGNSSDREFKVYVDAIALSAEIAVAGEPDDPVDRLTITFSAPPTETSALAATVSLTLDGTPVDIPGLSVAKSSETVYVVSGLSAYTKGYGTYVFTYDVRGVAKASSGRTGDAVATATWAAYPRDTTPPTVTEVRFGGAAPAASYVDNAMFSEIEVTFSEEVNVASLIDRGLAGQAFSLRILSPSGEVTGVAGCGEIAWDAGTFTARMTVDGSGIAAGRYRFVVDAALVEDMSGNRLAVPDDGGMPAGVKTFSPSLLMASAAYSYACPTLHDWDGDGLLDLLVGEKTADSKGKVRIYLNKGTASEPVFAGYAYLRKNGADVEFAGQGCVGMQVSFGDLPGATMALAASPGEVYVWNHEERDSGTGDAPEFVKWFDHATDSRFPSLIRTQTFCCDMDGDGVDDILVSGQNSPVFWMKRTATDDGAATVCTPLTDADGFNLAFPEGQNHTSAVLFDVNGDSVRDLVTGDSSGNVWVYYGCGNARFAAEPFRIYENADSSIQRSRLGLGDLNGDGVEDILVGRSDGSVLSLTGARIAVPAVPFEVLTTVSAAAGEHGSIAPSGVTVYGGGETPRYTITPDAGYHVADVRVDGVSVGAVDGYTFPPLAGGRTIAATFAATTYPIAYSGLMGAENPNPAGYTVEDDVVFAAPGEVYGWVFKGWTPHAISRGTTGPVDAVAEWERRTFTVTAGGVTVRRSYEDTVTFATNDYVNAGATQYVCKGWTAVNAVPASGDGPRAVFTVTGDVTFDWIWETNVVTLAGAVDADAFEWSTGGFADWAPEWSADSYDGRHRVFAADVADNTNSWIQTEIEGPGLLAFAWKASTQERYDMLQFIIDGETRGTISGETEWKTNSVRLTEGVHIVRWNYRKSRGGSGGEDTVWLDAVRWKKDGPATFAEALNAEMYWTTDGDALWSPRRRESVLDSRASWAEMTGLSDYGVSGLSTAVYGAGVLTFDWAVSCEEEYDYLDLIVDGELAATITGQVDWETYSIEIAGEGRHEVRWEYWKDEMDDPQLAGDNVARVDGVKWETLSEQKTVSTGAPVPFADIRNSYSTYWRDAGGDYEAAARAVGKNGRPVWESYVIGLDPENPRDRALTAAIELRDGEPVVTWTPDLNENGKKNVRVYKTLGRTSLDGSGPWVDLDGVSSDEKKRYRFFKVTVDVP